MLIAALWLAGCGPDPMGNWVGPIDFVADDGETYFNEMHLMDDGAASATLYALLPTIDPETNDEVLLIVVSEYDGFWKPEADVALDLRCDWDNCFGDHIVDCAFGDSADELVCDAWPDHYADDETLLTWVRSL